MPFFLSFVEIIFVLLGKLVFIVDVEGFILVVDDTSSVIEFGFEVDMIEVVKLLSSIRSRYFSLIAFKRGFFPFRKSKFVKIVNFF